MRRPGPVGGRVAAEPPCVTVNLAFRVLAADAGGFVPSAVVLLCLVFAPSLSFLFVL